MRNSAMEFTDWILGAFSTVVLAISGWTINKVAHHDAQIQIFLDRTERIEEMIRDLKDDIRNATSIS